MTRTYTDSTDTTRTRNGAVRLTDNLVKGLSAPKTGNRVTYDERLRGFGVRVTAKGKKAFILNYRISGRERRITVGSYPEWTLLAARRRAEELRRDVDLGIDPLQRRTDKMNEPTVQDLHDRYVSDHLPKKSQASIVGDLQMWKKSILPDLARRKLSDLTFNEIDALHRKITRRAPIQANRTIALLRKAFNLAMRWGWMKANPAVGIEANPENSRTRYLNEDEINRLLAALKSNPSRTSCDAILFMLLTGCRRGEAFKATWDQFDADLRIWTKPAATTKQRKLHRVPVSSAVTELLKARQDRSTSPFIFASHTGQALTDIKKTWTRICETAELTDFRLHDLRHTFASLLVSNGQTLPIIGAMLGHTQTQTTARYAHLFDDSLLNAAEVASGAIYR
ncbi:integrase [Loktanella sp. 3ANDIMAR09]|uniref:tyrosine-type recombinase/integrase n=1 Tax=Loktanella sp. 3ANDIMAR09 TaxID=1225657 RepID=UPI0007006AA7|nr:site-specific integrase [Loktanella sp. 3ANDIMAR09]KQI68574.1 integrase [Loktanella sp. 3ANDIMAR09]